MSERAKKRIPRRERDAILQSLRAGVVPRIGQHRIQVGRVNEVKALLEDIRRVADGGSGFRFVIGDYGSGKTFFLQLVRSIALKEKLVTMHADLSPERRLYSSGGHARALYAELARNMSTQATPDGGAMSSVVERFVTEALRQADSDGTAPSDVIRERLTALTELTGGFDFAQVIGRYWEGHDTGNDQLKSDAVRWLRGEFTIRTEARNALGVRTIIDDATVYDHLKLMARFVRLAGFKGLFACLDEMVMLYKLTHTQSRNSNYEQILRIVNDSTQGIAQGIGFIFGGTPDLLMDTRRGLYSHPALQGRLAENTFGIADSSNPVLRLENLSRADLYVLLDKLRDVQANNDPEARLLSDEGLRAYMAYCENRLGESYFRTPRTTIKGFLDLLAILEQDPDRDWSELLGQVTVEPDENPDLMPLMPDQDLAATREDDDLASFRL